MLEQLTLWNVGGIKHCRLDFCEGFIVITGESGAGKSSIVRALELAAGKRAQIGLIRAGEEEASSEVLFSTDLDFPDLDPTLRPTEGAFFAKRTLSKNGRGRAILQGQQVPLALYTTATKRLMHIQSQFAQMELLDTHRQLEMIDSCGGEKLQSLLKELRAVFEEARLKERELQDISSRRSEIERLYANATEIVPLVNKVNPQAGLEASLEYEISALSKKLTAKNKAFQNLDRLTGGLSNLGLLDELKNACHALTEALPEEISNEYTRLLQEGIQAFNDAIGTAQKAIGSSPAALAEELELLEHRLGSIRKLRRMTGTKTEEELLTYCQGALDGLAWLENSYELLEKTTTEAKELRRKASSLALDIRRERKQAASVLERKVNILFQDLAMDGIGFSIRFTELSKLRRDGADAVEFTLFTDKREGRVDKIASGGELSRLLLALQLSLPDEWLPSTLVFDEVEAGLGGKAAVLSGLKLQELSQKCQVILVTHEASIAALGAEHYMVCKNHGESCIIRLEEEDRIGELARMLSGHPDLPEAREHARRLLNAQACTSHSIKKDVV